MGSPGATIAAVASPEGVLEDLTGCLQGWKRKFFTKKSGILKRKDVSFLAPDGEELRNKRQLDKYLKNHPGSLIASDFDWSSGGGSPGETPRRSARLNSKGRLSTDSIEGDAEEDAELIATKRSKRQSRENGKDVSSLKTPAKVDDGKDEVIQDVERPEVPAEEQDTLVEEVQKETAEKPVDGSILEKNGEVEKDTVTEEAKPMDVDAPRVDSKEVSAEESAIELKEIKAEQIVAPGEEDVVVPAADVTKVDAPLETAPEALVPHVEVTPEPAVAADLKLEEPAKEQDPTEQEWRGMCKWKDSSSRSSNSLQLCSTSSSLEESMWDPTDPSDMMAVKTALHLSAVPSSILCREMEQEKVIRFCKTAVLEQRPSSMYVCGRPGTGKSLIMEKVKILCTDWTKEANMQTPEIISLNCTSLTDPRNIYQKLLKPNQGTEVIQSSAVCLKEIKKRLCDSMQRSVNHSKRMLLMIVDEMDYLITRDQAVLYDLFRLPTFPNSCCILIGVANAIDLTDRFLPNLRAMNCKPDVVTFPAYNKDQILEVLNQRLEGLSFTVFHPPALELCARKVAAASGDMRNALHVCRSALEILEGEVREELTNERDPGCSAKEDKTLKYCQRTSSVLHKYLVQIDHMARALACTFRCPVVETIQGLPQHQQMVLCSAVRLFRRAKKDATLGEVNKAYLDLCKSTTMHSLAATEFSAICGVLADQALFKLGTSREERLRRVTLQVDEDDVNFALQGVRFFRNCLS
ncbi:unnamed protein product [Sphagnum balticum]